MEYVYLIVGVIGVLYGADKLTDGASDLARRFKVSDLIIGLTIVAFGTSMPEFVISLMAAVQGASGISLGNIIGSNVFNVMAIVGVTAAVCPIAITSHTLKVDIPLALASSVLLCVFCFDDRWADRIATLSRWEGGVLLLCFVAFLFYTIHVALHQRRLQNEEENSIESSPNSPMKSIFFCLLGLVLLVAGGQLFVKGASAIALSWGVSETVVAITLVSGGTSLPELATSVVAARKGKSAMAIGNVVGSNLFNILWILGTCSLIRPLSVTDISYLDGAVLALSVVLLWVFSYSRRTVERWEGWSLLLLFVGYMVLVVMRA